MIVKSEITNKWYSVDTYKKDNDMPSNGKLIGKSYQVLQLTYLVLQITKTIKRYKKIKPLSDKKVRNY